MTALIFSWKRADRCLYRVLFPGSLASAEVCQFETVLVGYSSDARVAQTNECSATCCSYLRGLCSSGRHILTFFQGLCYSPYALRLDCRALGNMTGEHVPA
jgi:hypothetical protein